MEKRKIKIVVEPTKEQEFDALNINSKHPLRVPTNKNGIPYSASAYAEYLNKNKYSENFGKVINFLRKECYENNSTLKIKSCYGKDYIQQIGRYIACRKEVKTIKQCKYISCLKHEWELTYNIPDVEYKNLNDILAVMGTLRDKLWFDTRGDLVSELKMVLKLKQILYKMLRTKAYKDYLSSKQNKTTEFNKWYYSNTITIDLVAPGSDYDKDFSRRKFKPLLYGLRNLLCSKTDHSLVKNVYDDTYFSAGIVDIEEVNYSKYTVEEYFRNVVINIVPENCDSKSRHSIFYEEMYKYMFENHIYIFSNRDIYENYNYIFEIFMSKVFKIKSNTNKIKVFKNNTK
jgi:hypothetical protein